MEERVDSISRLRCPTHPGTVLREDVLPAIRMSVSAFARSIRVSRQTVHGLLSEKHGITPDMAVRLGAYLGNGPRLWLDMQSQYDLWFAEQKLVNVLPMPGRAPAAFC
jgi:antitoxin HigA-1